MRRRTTTRLLAACTLGALATLTGCTETSPPLGVDAADRFAAAPGGKGGGGGPTVSATDPAYGHQGQVGEQVRILGSGFEPGADVVWQRDGHPDSRVSVRSVAFVSSSELSVTIDIALDAELDFYDIAVTRPSDRKTGIGTEKFEVTLAVSIGTLSGNTLARGVNDNREVVGYSVVGSSTHAFYWSESTGMVDLGVGSAFGIDDVGQIVVGQSGSTARLWTRAGSNWVSSALPTAQDQGAAWSLASDPATGAALYAGGRELTGSRKKTASRPVLWKNVAGTWTRISMSQPAGVTADGWVQDVNANGQAVGAGGDGPVVWDAPTIVTRLPGPATGAQGISSDGNIVVGFYQTSRTSYPVYWVRQAGGVWAGPHALSDCRWGMDVDDAGNILATGCTGGTPAVWAPPYSTPLYLGQLGLANESAPGEAITNSGRYAVGGANSSGAPRLGVIWTIY